MTPTMLVLIVGGILALSLLGIFLYRQRHQSVQADDIGLADLRRCLDTLLARGYDLGFVCFTIPNDQRFVEFSKYVREGRVIGLTMDFPRASWAGPYYERVKGLLEARSLPYTVEDTPDGPVPEFIQVDVGGDTGLAADIAREIFLRVYDSDERIRLSAEFEHINPLDQSVGE